MENHNKKRKNWKIIVLLFMAVLMVAGVTTVMTQPQTVEAATKKTGWERQGNDWYYYKNGKMVKGQFITIKSGTYYLRNDGKMVTGWKKVKKKWYYFNKTSGAMHTGFLSLNGKRYYLSKKDGALYENTIIKISKSRRYYAQDGGALYTGFKEVNGKKYYFTEKGAKRDGWYKIGSYWYYMNTDGTCRTGWFDWKNAKGVTNKYYCRKDGSHKGAMMTGSNKKIYGKYYNFSSSGALLSSAGSGAMVSKNLETPTSAKTIRNYLLNAMKPVGNTLYVWGGGWAAPTNNYKGLYPLWSSWYNSNSGSYNYANYKDLSISTRKKGLDCSGFVAWATYQVMNTRSGGTPQIVEASVMASTFASRGYGTLYKQSALSKNGYKGKFKAGDVCSKSGHVWICVGQCTDGSYVLVHATPPCVQIAGTPTPSGSYSSNAIALAKKYMQRYYPSTVSKFGLGGAATVSYINACNVLRWNNNTLKDPDGFKDKTAASILKSLFGE